MSPHPVAASEAASRPGDHFWPARGPIFGPSPRAAVRALRAGPGIRALVCSSCAGAPKRAVEGTVERTVARAARAVRPACRRHLAQILHGLKDSPEASSERPLPCQGDEPHWCAQQQVGSSTHVQWASVPSSVQRLAHGSSLGTHLASVPERACPTRARLRWVRSNGAPRERTASPDQHSPRV